MKNTTTGTNADLDVNFNDTIDGNLFVVDNELGGSGADIGPLKKGDIVLAGLRPDSQRYFDHHHAATDTFEHVNKRELELGAATMTSLIYLVDKYGIKRINLEKDQKL